MAANLDLTRWYEGKIFTTDWTSAHFETWVEILAPMRDRVVEVLEIGSWEGRSAIFFLEFFPLCRLTCIDTFAGSSEHAHIKEAVASIERRFDANLSGYGPRLKKIKSRSVRALDQLAEEGRVFDVIYIDGSHRRDDVVIDSILAWKILRQDGFLIWDDYLWGAAELSWADRPQQGIDAFLKLQDNDLTVCRIGGQVIVQKRPSGNEPLAKGWTFPRTPRSLLRFLLGKPIGIFR